MGACTDDEDERMFVAVRVDARRRDEKHFFIHVNAIDLDRQQIEIVKPGSINAIVRATGNATKRREVADFDGPAPSGLGTSPSSNWTERAKTPRRDVDQHLGPILK